MFGFRFWQGLADPPNLVVLLISACPSRRNTMSFRFPKAYILKWGKDEGVDGRHFQTPKEQRRAR